MLRRIYSLIALVCVMSVAGISIDTPIAKAGWFDDLMCRLYPQTCRDKDPDGNTPRVQNSHDRSIGTTLVKPPRKQATFDTYVFRGYFYWQQKEYRLAKANYNKALEIATASKDKRQQALAYAGLAEVNLSLKNKQTAVSYLKRARIIFGSIDDKESAKIVANRLNEVIKQQ